MHDNTDKVKKNEVICKATATIYMENPSHFGPLEVTQMTEEARTSKEEKRKSEKQQKIDRAMTRTGYNKVKERTKDMCIEFGLL